MMNNSYYIGLDVGGTRLKAAIVATDGSLEEKRVFPSRMREDYRTMRDQMISVIRDLILITGKPPAGIGVGVAGLVDLSHRKVLAAPNCPAVVGKPLADDVEAEFRLPCRMENDANAMAIGERRCGAATGCNDLVAVTLGTGVGGAIISGGRLVTGFIGGGGEIGHVCIDRNGPRCGCGANGCLEAFIGMRGIFRWTARRYPSLKGMGVARMVEAAEAGNEDAAEVFAYVGRTLGVGLSGMVNVFNPRILLIGGGVASAGEKLLAPLKDEIQRRAFGVYLDGLEIKSAKLGNWAGVVGAALAEGI